MYNQFAHTGDSMRSSRSDLEMVINAGVRTVLSNGDADYICNYIGFEAMVRPSRFLSPLLPTFCADPVTTCADRLLKHVVFGTVRGAELHDIYRQGLPRRSVQERGQILVPTGFRRRT